jgi:hypothetical protein
MGKQKNTYVRGAMQAMQSFRNEIAKEIGLWTPSFERAPRKLPKEVIADEMSKRMIQLAENQIPR